MFFVFSIICDDKHILIPVLPILQKIFTPINVDRYKCKIKT